VDGVLLVELPGRQRCIAFWLCVPKSRWNFHKAKTQMVLHPVMDMALCYDYRVVDGVAADSFRWRVAERIEAADFEI
jgi:pyruvate/2-oxoglutarate dehydrogenase complex dihydrolipoamide acyltransferase (E2) component